jgi:hypothetical protein
MRPSLLASLSMAQGAVMYQAWMDALYQTASLEIPAELVD